MRKIMLVAAALAVGAVEMASAEEMKVTGKVTEANQEEKQITVGIRPSTCRTRPARPCSRRLAPR